MAPPLLPKWWNFLRGALLGKDSLEEVPAYRRQALHPPFRAGKDGETMETLWQDLRYGFRMLARNPGFTAVAVLTLALGIGANTAIFSVVNAVLFQPLDYEEPDRLYLLWTTNPGWARPESASLPDFLDWREQNQVFEDLAAISRRSLNLTGDGEPERLIGSYVSSSFFSLLRVQPSAGRGFLPGEDAPGAEHVAVLGYGLWQRRFGADPSLVGKTISLNGNDHTVVGIAPEDFQLFQGTDLWLPLALDASQPQFGRRSDFLRVLGRLKPDVREDRAQAEMTTIAKRLEQEYPQTNTNIGVVLVPLHEHFVGNVRPALLVLLGAAGFVLLIACANVANLLLARAASREKEVAIRAALGASRFRLVRQLLTESVLLALLGGSGGLLLAMWGTDGLVRLSPAGLPRLNEIAVNEWVLGFTLLVSVIAGVLFGLVPALHASRLEMHESLKEGGRGSADQGGRRRLRSVLVVSEVALALMLLIGAGLMITSVYRLQQVSPGFNTENLLVGRVNLPAAKYSNPSEILGFSEQLIERLEGMPGIRAVTTTDDYPLSSGSYLSFVVEGRPAPPPSQVVDAIVISVTPGYHRALGILLVRGRAFTRQDGPGDRLVVVINQAMAKKHFPSEDPIGQRLAYDGPDGQPNWREIVGVVADVRHEGLDQDAYPEFHMPFSQKPSRGMTVLVRTESDPSALVGAVRGAVQAIDPNQPVYAVRTMDTILSRSVAQQRFTMVLLGMFATVALVLAAIGIYGVISYSVSRRTHEIGIRMALGAQPRDIFRLVVGQGMVLTLIGVGVGLAGAFALTRFLESLLFGVSATDPATFAGVALLLAAVALLACYLPARRATKVDPLVALRYE